MTAPAWYGDFAGRRKYPKSFILDGLSGLVGVTGYQRMLASWRSPLIRVRRSSDNAQSDIYARADGHLDSTALRDFVGAGSGFVVTRYDQSGAGRHFTQATAAAQPRIVNAGTTELLGERPAERFGLASGVGYIGTGFTLAQPYTIIMTWMALGPPPSSEHTLVGREASGSSYIYAPGSQVRVNAGVQIIPAAYTANVPQLLAFVFNGGASRIVINGAAGGPLNPGADALNNTLYFGYNALLPARILNGYMPEIIIMAGAVPDADIIKIQRAIAAPRGIII